MSREIIADPVAALPRPRSARSRPDVQLELPTPDGATARPQAAGRRHRGAPTALALLALAALLGGAVAGDRHATDLARRQAAADTRLLIWADGWTVPGDGEAEAGRRPGLQLSLAVAGRPVTVLRLLLGAGSAEPSPGLQVRPGEVVTADLTLQPDCAVLGRTGADPRALGTARAVVRFAELEGAREVPVAVLGDPTGVMLPLLAPCAGGGYGTDGGPATDGSS